MQDLLKQNLIAVTQAQKTICINADIDSIMCHVSQVLTALGSRLHNVSKRLVSGC